MFVCSKIYSYLYTSFKINNAYRTGIATDKGKTAFGEYLNSSNDNMFVLGCNLGQRYSDLVRISPDNFKNGVLTIVQQNTGTKCYVPISTMRIVELQRLEWLSFN